MNQKTIEQLGKTTQLSNGSLTRVEIDDDHYYFHDGIFHISVTNVIDVGGPFPEGLRNWLRWNDANETTEFAGAARDRGSKLHDALEKLANKVPLNSNEYPTKYEKEAIVTFIHYMRFLQPQKFVTEYVVSDPAMRVSGTVDFKGYVDERRLELLLDPTKYLERDENGDFQVKEKYADMLDGQQKLIKIIIDWKFTSRNAYSHKVQVAKYAQMDDESYADEQKIQRKFTWRYSPKHKNKFDFQESLLTHESFNRIYDTTIEYLGKFPEPPEIVVYPDKFILFENVTKEAI